MDIKHKVSMILIIAIQLSVIQMILSTINHILLQEDSFQVRHCAFCLKVCGFPTKKCGKCQRRAYCSKECQAADWSVKGKGQRHVNWCGRYEYGEEDIDWEVVPVPGKGLGVRAKRLIPAGYRIMVDPIFKGPNDHEGINIFKI